MAKFLITGATGFIGANLTHTLIKNGESVFVLSRNKELNWRLKDIAHHIEIINVDLLDETLEEKVKSAAPDYIFHCAAYGALPKENDLSKTIDVNIKGTVNLLNAAKQSEIKLFINAGSSSEYGVLDSPMKESDTTFPINDYGIAKLAATLYCKKEAEKLGLPVITIRLFSPYGYFEAPTRFVPTVIMQALEGKNISLSKQSNVRDFIFIEDVVRAYLAAIKVEHTPGTIYNIGSGNQHSIEEVVIEILKQTKSTSQAKWLTVPIQERQIEPTTWEANIFKANKILKWQPKYSLEKGLEKTIEWFSLNRHLYE